MAYATQNLSASSPDTSAGIDTTTPHFCELKVLDNGLPGPVLGEQLP
jgi:hypothetical protein